MKTKNLLSVMLLVTCALTLTSCSNDDGQETDSLARPGTLTLTAEAPQYGTRTELSVENGVLTPMWSAGDTLYLMSNRVNPDSPDHHLLGGKQQNIYMFKFNSPRPAAKASFEFIGDEAMRQRMINDINLNIKDGNKMVAAYMHPVSYYYSQELKDIFGESPLVLYDAEHGYACYSPDGLMVMSGVEQNLVLNDQKTSMRNDFLISQYIEPAEIKKAMDNGTPLLLQFKRLTSVVRLNIINKTDNDLLEKENITSVRLSNCYGPYFAYIENLDKNQSPTGYDICLKADKGNLLTFNTDREKDDNTLYFCCSPFVTSSSAAYLHLTLINDKGKFFILELEIPDGGIRFEAGKITTLNITLTNMRQGFVDYEVGGIIHSLVDDAIEVE